MAGQSPHRSRHHGFTTVGAGYGCKTQRQAREICAGAVVGFAAFLDGAEQFAHGPVKPLLKPRPHKLRSGHARCGV